MSLIQCPECNKDVSTQASSCPHCGAPISPPQEIKVVTERTSKNYKGYLILSGVAILLGFCAFRPPEEGAPNVAGWLILIGIIGYIVTKVLIWWQHD